MIASTVTVVVRIQAAFVLPTLVIPWQVILDTGSSDLWIDTSGSEAELSKGQAVKTNRTILLQYGVDGVYTYARGAAEYADVQLGAGMIAYNQSFGASYSL